MSESTHQEELYYSYEEAKKVVQQLGIKTYREWYMYASPYYLEFKPDNTIEKKGIKPPHERRDPRLPFDPAAFYKRRGEWKGWGDFLGTGAISNKDKKYLSYQDARKVVHSLKVRSAEEYEKLVETLGPSFGLPPHPHAYYMRNEGHFSWRDFLYPRFVSYDEAKQILAAKDEIVTVADFRKARKEDPDLQSIPSSPHITYQDEWEDWPTFLDSKRKRQKLKNLLLLQSRKSVKGHQPDDKGGKD
ncbi:hypothetical protein D6779_09835 [Candidatus Parcubacteria bacterium]|nr:MAG: hypothetical protein D6779_09835 [Candidatus Parcubacteria bacterium]